MSDNKPAADNERAEQAKRDGSDPSHTVHKIHQNGHDLFYTTIPVDDLFPFTFAERFYENSEYLAKDGMSISINVGAMFDVFDEFARKPKKHRNTTTINPIH